MGKRQQHIDNDIVKPKVEYNDIDIVSKGEGEARKKVLSKISEYKLDIIQNFMFGGSNKNFGDNRPFVNTAIKLNYLNDVSVLCTDCHMAVHNIRRSYERK